MEHSDTNTGIAFGAMPSSMSASPPVTKYASSGDVSIAYRVYGDGPLDLIFVPGLVSHIEFLHELPGYTEWIDSLASFARLIVFDKRGQGLSDRGPGAPSIEERMLDIGAVMDAVGIERVAILGYSEGASISAVFAATYPERTQALILYAGSPAASTRRTTPSCRLPTSG